MSEEQTVYSADLAGVVVGETAISDVQGETGLLSYRGIDINELIGEAIEKVAKEVAGKKNGKAVAEQNAGV